MRWVNPITIDRLLDNVIDPSISRPPSANGVYVISLKGWSGTPTGDCVPLYVGSNTSDSPLFRTRIGALVADAFGLYTDVKNGGHHSGGQSLHRYCLEHRINPKSLYIGWVEDCKCHRCAETEVWDRLAPSLNKNKPADCPKHAENTIKECFPHSNE